MKSYNLLTEYYILTLGQCVTNIETTLSETSSLCISILKKMLYENSKEYFRNLEKMCKISDERDIIDSYVWLVLVEKRPLFCEVTFKELRKNKTSTRETLSVLLDLTKVFIYLTSVNFEGNRNKN